MKKFLMIGAVAGSLFLASCSKDQAVVKDLEGTWTITEYSEDGVAQDISGFTTKEMTFTSCKLKKEDVCPATMTIGTADFTQVENMTYSISGDGTILTTTTVSTVSTAGGVSQTETCTGADDCTSVNTITEQTNDKLVYTNTRTDGRVSKMTLTKK